MYLIETNDLTKRYGNTNVVDSVNMHIPEGVIYGFVGENGSGKTTIMRMLTGLAEPTRGTYSICGVSNKSRKIYSVRQNMSAIVETASLVPTMTAKENMEYAALYLGLKITEAEKDALLKQVHLENVGKKKVKNFSLGMKQRIAIAMALINKPKFMLLDEPLNGLDPQGIVELRNLLIELNQKEGISILISSHILSELEKVASCYGFIKKGKLIQEISATELFARCKKSLTIFVDDITKAKETLAKLKCTNFESFTNGEIRIYDDVETKKVVKALVTNDVEVLSVNSNDQSVEDYYLNLIKGDDNNE